MIISQKILTAGSACGFFVKIGGQTSDDNILTWATCHVSGVAVTPPTRGMSDVYVICEPGDHVAYLAAARRPDEKPFIVDSLELVATRGGGLAFVSAAGSFIKGDLVRAVDIRRPRHRY